MLYLLAFILGAIAAFLPAVMIVLFTSAKTRQLLAFFWVVLTGEPTHKAEALELAEGDLWDWYEARPANRAEVEAVLAEINRKLSVARQDWPMAQENRW